MPLPPLPRRELLRLLFASPPLLARVDYRDYSRVLPDFLSRVAAEGLQRRNRALAAAMSSADTVRRRQEWCRTTFWKLVGGEPESSRLQVRVTGAFERPAYRVEKLIYESRPGFHVSANLYLPKSGGGPHPGVLFQCGHSLNGKAASFYQYCCQGLVQLGFVVLAFDPTGQGERTIYPAPGSNTTRLDSADAEHTVPGKQLLLAGLTSTQIQTWDAVRSLDVLAQHPQVDPKRLATTGNSGGGTLSMFLAAVDSRLACVSAACPNTENLISENFNSPGPSDDAEQNILDSGAAGFDRWDTLWPFAPKPLQIIVSAKDFFGTYSPRYIENGRSEFARLRNAYRLLGNQEKNLEWVESPIPHGLSYHVRMQIYRWFRLHLQGISEPLAQEPPVQAEKDATLNASPTGNVIRDLGCITPRQIAVAHVARMAKASPSPEALKRALRLGAIRGTAAVKKGEADSRFAKIDAMEVESEAGVFLPVWVFRPKASAPAAGGPVLIVVEPGGRNSQWNEDSIYPALAARGITVWAPDLRGIGDLRPEYPRHAPGNARNQQGEEAQAWSSMVLGRPLLGQRVADLLAIAAAIPGKKRIAARGDLTVVARFAAALDPAVERVYLSGGPASYRALLEVDDAGPTANLLFNGIGVTDLTDLAPGRTAVGGAWDTAVLAGFALA
jgi:dienelactone hydrolase